MADARPRAVLRHLQRARVLEPDARAVGHGREAGSSCKLFYMHRAKSATVKAELGSRIVWSRDRNTEGGSVGVAAQ